MLPKQSHRRFLPRCLELKSSMFQHIRSLSSKSDNSLVQLDFHDEIGVGVLTMNRPPANTLSLEMFQAMSEAIQTAEANTKTQALIVASSSPKIFSAGLDLAELYQPNSDRIEEFWNSFQQLYVDLYGSRLSTFAAMSGHAPAAGCMIALSCDYRLFSSTGGKIGLNESLLGIAAPPWLGQQYMDTIGHRRAELALSLGTLFSPQEALDIGLVDQLVTDGDVIDAAKREAHKWIRIPMEARVGAKELTRGPQIQNLLDNRQEDTDHFVSFVTKESVQKSLDMYIEQMKKKK
jgi:Delta3-Delta2-enoyl-CoA isomerase